MSGRSLASPAFPDDDGTADEEVRALLASTSPFEAAAQLQDVRLLATVVAVLDEEDESGADKDSHMAVVSMVNAAGERGMLAFTGLDSLRAWSPDARPVPVLGRELARAAIEDGAAAIVIDVAGPTRVALDGLALHRLASGP
jgi:hypothetical protein